MRCDSVQDLIKTLHFGLPLSQKLVPIIGILAIDQARRFDASFYKTGCQGPSSLIFMLGAQCRHHGVEKPQGSIVLDKLCGLIRTG